MAQESRVFECVTCFRRGGVAEDELERLIRLQHKQLVTAINQCNRLDTILKKLDGATATLQRSCEAACRQTSPQPELKSHQQQEKHLEPQLGKQCEQQLQEEQNQLVRKSEGLPLELNMDDIRYNETVEQILEEKEEELFNKTAEKIEIETVDQIHEGTEEENKQTEKIEIEEQNKLKFEQKEPLQPEQPQKLDMVLVQKQQDDIDLELVPAVKEDTLDHQFHNELEWQDSDETPTRMWWYVAAACFSGVSVLVSGLFPSLYTTFGDPQLLHFSPIPF